MTFTISPPRSMEKPRMTATATPSISSLGRSPSPSLGAPPAYTTHDLIAARNMRYARWLQMIRIGISGITMGVSIAVIACISSSLKKYSNSNVDPEWLLPLWPLEIDLRPSHTILACGIIVLVFSVAYMVFAFVPLQRKLHWQNLTSTIMSFLALFVTLFTTIFACIITNNHALSRSSGSLSSWTCKWQDLDNISPAQFMDICNEGTAALDLVILLVILEFLQVAISAWGWWVEMCLKRVARGGVKSEIELV